MQAEPSPAWMAATRSSARQLLITEASVRRGLMAIIAATAAQASAELAAHEDASRSVTTATLATILLLWTRRASSELAESLRKARSAGRRTGAARAAAELKAGGAASLVSRLKPPRLEAHDAQAVSAADSLAQQWHARAHYEARRAQRRARAGLVTKRSEATAAGAVYRTPDAMASPIGRTAATETAQAYDEGHVEATEGLVDENGSVVAPELVDEFAGRAMLDRWSAILDGRTCSTCGALDGAHTPLAMPFASGEEPGWVHPWCRCIRTVDVVTLQ
jgi:hypothetical protein